MQITQCKECGHENPKKFMSYEYTSHAPNCPQDIKQTEEHNTNCLRLWKTDNTFFLLTGGDYNVEKCKKCIRKEDIKQLREEFNNAFDLDNYGESHIVNEKVAQWWLEKLSITVANLINQSTGIVAKHLYENNYDLCIRINKELQDLINNK